LAGIGLRLIDGCWNADAGISSLDADAQLWIYFYENYFYRMYFYRALKFLSVDCTVVRIT
jgi:hypothetical protein